MADFDIVRGSSETLYCALKDQDGAAINLSTSLVSSSTLYANLSMNATTPTLTFTMSTYGNAGQGIVTYSFAPTDTASVAPGLYYAEVVLVLVSGGKYITVQPFTIGVMERVKL